MFSTGALGPITAEGLGLAQDEDFKLMCPILYKKSVYMCVRVVVIVKRCTLPTLGKTLNTSALYILVSESTVEYWMEQRFTWRRDRA